MDVFEEAIVFATQKHSGQVRKDNSPYILHPLEVASIVGTVTTDRETLAACVLHDTVEDTDTTLEELREKFGKRVALLVMTETEEKRPDRPPAETWKLRKEETLAILENTRDPAVRMMWLGDKLSNVRSFSRMYRKEGDDLWKHFNQKDPAKQAWYYHRILEYLNDLRDSFAYQELAARVKILFQNVSPEDIEKD